MTGSTKNLSAHGLGLLERYGFVFHHPRTTMNTPKAKSGLPIRLTEERWQHIMDGHPELASLKSEIIQAIEEPDRIFAGNDDELLAVKSLDDGKYLVIVYRECDQDGFVITAYMTRRINSLNQRQVLWPLQL
jgi:hypothetical protein